MKKLVFVSVVALASVGFIAGSTLRAQDQGGQTTIKDPAEYNAYQWFSIQTDPKAKAEAGKSFLETYPQSVVKKPVLDAMLDANQQAGDAENVLETATRLLQVDPNNMKAILYSVMIKKQQCGQKSDAAICDEAATLARKGLQAPKPAETSDDDWKKITTVAYPIFASAIGLDAAISKKDLKLAQEEYTKELQMYKSGPTLSSINDMIKQAKTPAEQIHDLIASTPDLKSLPLADKETVLALGSKEDADKLWALFKDQQTQVPGVVIEANANTVKVAVTQDARDTKTADFVVNLKKPLTDADLNLIQPGFEFKPTPGASQLVGTYDSFTQTPATPTTAQAAVIVLRDGEYIPEKKKGAPVHHASAHPTHRPAQ